MSEFEKELLNKVSPHDRTHNGNELFLGGVLTEHFKDWQPPREREIDNDKLSVEKLQEHLLPYKKETVQKIIDEKMQLVTADEFLKLHKESLTAIRENDKLQEQLNTAKKALTEISSTRQEVWRGGTLVGLEATEDAKIAFDALAAIGGCDE